MITSEHKRLGLLSDCREEHKITHLHESKVNEKQESIAQSLRGREICSVI